MNVLRLNVLDLPTLQPLIERSQREGFRFVMRLWEGYQSGANRFDGPGEALFGAFDGGTLVGIIGLNRDPYANDPSAGRVRHLYVLPACRGLGVGRGLVRAVVAEARRHYRVLGLRTDSPDAAIFYLVLGFEAVSEPYATHRLRFDVR